MSPKAAENHSHRGIFQIRIFKTLLRLEIFPVSFRLKLICNIILFSLKHCVISIYKQI